LQRIAAEGEREGWRAGPAQGPQNVGERLRQAAGGRGLGARQATRRCRDEQRRRQRDPQYFLVSVAVPTEDEWALAVPLGELLAWAWQRWEVEVMHRELKSGFGLGEQQAWSARGAATVVLWVVWTYALLMLAGYQTWGVGPAPGPHLAAFDPNNASLASTSPLMVRSPPPPMNSGM